MSLLDFFRQKPVENKKFLELLDELIQLRQQIKAMQNDINRVEIIALEARKKYAKKLTGETEEKEKDPMSSIFIAER